MAAIASSMALADGWTRGIAFGLWAALTLRVVPTILYVRARLKTLHRQEASTGVVITMHTLALVVVLALAWMELTPALAIIAFLILIARTLFGFSGSDRQASARQIGFRELGFGAMTVAVIALGHYFNL